MNSIELVVARLRSLPPASQVQVVDYIQQLHDATRAERLEALQKTAGCLSAAEAETMEKVIREGCERVDD